MLSRPHSLRTERANSNAHIIVTSAAALEQVTFSLPFVGGLLRNLEN